MKKNFRNKRVQNIMFFILGALIFGSVGIVATTNILEAKYVMYTRDGETMTVQDAIKDLYGLANNKVGSNQTLAIGTVKIDGYKITIPYTGSYHSVGCVYGTDENYGSIGTLDNNTCYFYGTSSNQTLYYKVIATDDAGKIYEASGSEKTIETSFADVVNVGDYIYMKPTKESYSITPDMTGCVSGAKVTWNNSDACGGINGASQTINPSELTVWRVISKNSDGTVDVVSENVSSANVYFYGQTGYQKLIETLNTIAAQYTSDYVERTRHMGYSNQTQNITTTTKIGTTPAPWTTNTSSSTTSADEALGAGDMGYETDYNLVQTALGTRVANNPSGTATKYWLASRYYVYQRFDSIYWYFCGRFIGTDGSLNFWDLYYYSNGWDNSSPAYAVRPILTLKSTVKIISGTGTSSDYYQLGI